MKKLFPPPGRGIGAFALCLALAACSSASDDAAPLDPAADVPAGQSDSSGTGATSGRGTATDQGASGSDTSGRGGGDQGTGGADAGGQGTGGQGTGGQGTGGQGTGGQGTGGSDTDDRGTDVQGTGSAGGQGTTGGGTGGPSGSPIAEPPGLYESDGYGTVDVLRVDVRTVTTPGVCTPDDQSGCTLADVIADTDSSDALTVEIPVHFRADDFADDGSESNAELRQRGGFTRLAPQKSFRVKLDDKDVLWRGERRLQLNKNPYDSTNIRNKLAFDLMSTIEHLPAVRTQFVNLWIDDGAGPENYGLFTHAEAIVKEYLVKRGWGEDDNLYKAERFVFAQVDLDYLALDAEGAPLDEDRFEERLEIKRGDDHRKLVEMIRAINDPSRGFESVFERYFDEENVLTWVAVNFLLHQIDAVTHNFYLYNPEGSEKFYFIPWDYDDAFDVEVFPPNDFGEEALLKRLSYGYAKGRASNFLDAYYQRPGIHGRIVARADELRRGPLMDSEIGERATRYTDVVAPIALAHPEDRLLYDRARSGQFVDFVTRSHRALQSDYGIPLPPSLATPEVENGRIEFRFSGAYDVTGGEITYDIEIASSPTFAPGTRVLLETGIPNEGDPGRLAHSIDASRVPSGRHYARLVARSSRDPARYWQIAGNRESIGGTTYIGVRGFTVP